METVAVTNPDMDKMMDIIDPYVPTFNNVLNPFYLKSSGSEIAFIKNNILMDNYKSLYILCMKNDINYDNDDVRICNILEMYNNNDTCLDDLYCNNIFKLVECDISIINIFSVRKGLIQVHKSVLQNYNDNSYKLNDNCIVFLMLETKEMHVLNWLKIYKKKNRFDEFVKNKIFTQFYELSCYNTQEYFLSLIKNMSNFKYWDNSKNCILNKNKKFSCRTFNIKICNWNLNLQDIEKKLSSFLTQLEKENMKSNKHDSYNNSNITQSEEQKQNYDSKSSYYEIVTLDKLEIDSDVLLELINGKNLNMREKLTLVCHLLASKDYCHVIFKNIHMFESCEQLFKIFAPIIKYYFGYAWITLYIEESILKTKIVDSDRCIIDINVASKLPNYPFCATSPYMNPYYSVLVSDKNVINVGVCPIDKSVNEYAGIVDLTEFQKRLRIFISGTTQHDLLEGLDWSNIVITGGCMAAILPKFNKLMLLFANDINSITDDNLNMFFNEYYNNSDIDIACNHENLIDFIKVVKRFNQTLCTNITQIYNVKDPELRIVPNKSLTIFINESILKEKCDSGEIPFDFKTVVEKCFSKVVKTYFYSMYIKIKDESNIVNRQILSDNLFDDEYSELVSYVDVDKIKLIINKNIFDGGNESNKDPIKTVFYINEGETRYIKMVETLKFNISSKYLPRPFELFKFSNVHFISCIARFHLPCVRSYYDGSNCFMLPSAITAYQTMINIDYRYFVGKHDPIKILNKYRQRGYGTLLNNIEIKQYISYALTSDTLKKQFQIENDTDISKIVGLFNVNNNYYKLHKIFPKDFHYVENIVTYKNVPVSKNTVTLENYYKNMCPDLPIEFIKFRIINSEGNIEPVKMWLIDAGYDLICPK